LLAEPDCLLYSNETTTSPDGSPGVKGTASSSCSCAGNNETSVEVSGDADGKAGGEVDAISACVGGADGSEVVSVRPPPAQAHKAMLISVNAIAATGLKFLFTIITSYRHFIYCAVKALYIIKFKKDVFAPNICL